MILSLPYVALSLRWVPPGVAILGSSCLFLNNWLLIRILTLPFPRRIYARLEEKLYSNYQAMVGFYYEIWSGVEFCFYGDKIPDEPENVLYLSNHQSSVDWIISEVLCVKQGGYGGRARYILKDTIKYLPLYGWYLGQRGGVFVKRRSDADKRTLVRGLRRFVEEDIPVWLVIFPEGTRYNSKRLEQSKEYALKLGLKALDHVLTPKTAGLELALEHIGSHFDALYDITIYYEGMGRECGRGTPPHLFNFFCGTCSKVHIHVARTPLADMPKDTEARKAWLYDAFTRKDKLLKEVTKLGRYDTPRVPHPLFLSLSLAPTVMFTGITIGALCTRAGRLWWMASFALFTLVTFISAAL